MTQHNESQPVTRCRDCAYYYDEGLCGLFGVVATEEDGCTFGDAR